MSSKLWIFGVILIVAAGFLIETKRQKTEKSEPQEYYTIKRARVNDPECPCKKFLASMVRLEQQNLNLTSNFGCLVRFEKKHPVQEGSGSAASLGLECLPYVVKDARYLLHHVFVRILKDQAYSLLEWD